MVNRLDMAPPTLGLIFLNNEVGQQIFRKWIRKLGHDDEFHELRISIIEGGIPGMDDGYTVIVGSSMDGEIARAKKDGYDVNTDFYIGASSICRLPHPNSVNLEAFKSAFLRHGRYYVVPMSSDSEIMTPNLQLSIMKKKLIFRNVKDVPENDPDGLIHNVNALSYSYYMMDLVKGGITFFSKELVHEYSH